MVPLDAIEARAGDHTALDQLLLPADTALESFPAVQLSAVEAYYLGNGNPVGHAQQGVEGFVRVYDDKSAFLGVGQVLEDGRIAPKRLFKTD